MATQAKTTASAKISRPVTLKHLAASLADKYKLTKRHGEALLNDLVGLITKQLKRGERIRIAGFWHPAVEEAASSHGAQSSNR